VSDLSTVARAEFRGSPNSSHGVAGGIPEEPCMSIWVRHHGHRWPSRGTRPGDTARSGPGAGLGPATGERLTVGRPGSPRCSSWRPPCAARWSAPWCRRSCRRCGGPNRLGLVSTRPATGGWSVPAEPPDRSAARSLRPLR
jgi:hypothetical protein